MKLLSGDCLEQLKLIPENSIDSLITDPPAGISFMGKDWDDDKGGRKEWIAWLSSVMLEAKRVLKPGAHGLVWAIPRTSHWTATALEDAGFEIRDVITHLFGSGFPKSHNIEKIIGDVGKGYGTALKPAAEFWILIRKPCSEKTVASNVLKHGTGGINIDASRISTDWAIDPTKRGWQGRNLSSESNISFVDKNKELSQPNSQGRFPANLVFSCTNYCTEETHDIECAIRTLDEQSGDRPTNFRQGESGSGSPGMFVGSKRMQTYMDSGGASRFFYCAKASKSDKNNGLEGMPDSLSKTMMRGTSGSGKKNFKGGFTDHLTKNHHPTVKSTKLMSYLIKLITPVGGVVLDPFMGSGSTGVAAKREGFSFIGIEKEKEYFEIAENRINA